MRVLRLLVRGLSYSGSAKALCVEPDVYKRQVFGAVWGAIPGIFKAYLNINEVITSIMFNWIGLYLVNEIIYGRGAGVMYDAHNTRTWKLATNAPQAQIPSCGMSELFLSLIHI